MHTGTSEGERRRRRRGGGGGGGAKGEENKEKGIKSRKR